MVLDSLLFAGANVELGPVVEGIAIVAARKTSISSFERISMS